MSPLFDVAGSLGLMYLSWVMMVVVVLISVLGAVEFHEFRCEPSLSLVLVARSSSNVPLRAGIRSISVFDLARS